MNRTKGLEIVLIFGFVSEHTVHIGGVLRYRLSHIPKFNDKVVMETEDMNHSCSRVLWIPPNMRVNRNEIPFLESMFNLKDLVRILDGIFLHGKHKRVSISTEKGIMMAEILYYIISLIGLS